MPVPGVWVVSLVAFSLAAVTQAAEPAPVPLDGVAAIVDDVVLFRSDVADRARHLDSKLPEAVRRKELAAQLQRLIDDTLIEKDAAQLRVEVTAAEVESGFAMVAASGKLDRAQLAAEVARSGYAPAEYEREIRRQLLQQKWLVVRAAGKVDHKSLGDGPAFESAMEKLRVQLLAGLRAQAYLELR